MQRKMWDREAMGEESRKDQKSRVKVIFGEGRDPWGGKGKTMITKTLVSEPETEKKGVIEAGNGETRPGRKRNGVPKRWGGKSRKVS